MNSLLDSYTIDASLRLNIIDFDQVLLLTQAVSQEPRCADFVLSYVYEVSKRYLILAILQYSTLEFEGWTC